MPAKGQTEDVIVRLQRKTRNEGECWVFTGNLVGRGYGKIWYNGKSERLNRLICHLWYGADLRNQDWTANHTDECTNNACWNPKHLYVGTQYQNVQDQIRTGRFHYGSKNLNGGENYDKEKADFNRRMTKSIRYTETEVATKVETE